MSRQPDVHSPLVRRLRRFLSPVPWRIVSRKRLYHATYDRYLLEEVIFPSLHSRADVQDLLFVGCDTYTAAYPKMFADRQFVTIDVDPAKARYGAPRHIVDTIGNLEAHVLAESHDAVILNGVIGHGLDTADDIDQAVQQCVRCLRPGGLFIVGWNDMPPWRTVPFEEIEGFRAFAPLTLPPFPGPTYQTLGPMRHVFDFYVRPSAHDK
jgi:SAM-dependent methyltransferase